MFGRKKRKSKEIECLYVCRSSEWGKAVTCVYLQPVLIKPTPLFLVFLKPHGDASWGNSNPKTDFNRYVERTIVTLHQEHPNWKGLYVVEGVGDHADADYHAPYKIWWGSDVSGVVKHPIDVGHPDVSRRIVFSPRIYGTDVFVCMRAQ